MEFSNARSGRKRTEETLPWAKASQHSVSNCAKKQPSVWMKSGKSDNEVIVLPAQAILLFLTLPWAVLATGRHRLGLPQVAGNPLSKGEGTGCFQETRIPQQHRRRYHLFLAAHQTKKGGEQGSRSPVSFVQRTQSQQHGSASCFFVQPLAYY